MRKFILQGKGIAHVSSAAEISIESRGEKFAANMRRNLTWKLANQTNNRLSPDLANHMHQY